jgi:hypothetical protein
LVLTIVAAALPVSVLLQASGRSLALEGVSVRGAVYGEGLLNTDKQLTVADGRLDFEVDIDMLTFGGAYRVYSLGDHSYNPAGIEPGSELKHRYVEITAHGLDVRAGHFFTTFGRGLTLRSFEDMDLEHDTALDGMLAEYEAGPVKLIGLSGRMRERPGGLRYFEHRLRGGRVRYGGLDWMVLGISGVDRNSDLYDKQDLPGIRRGSYGDDVWGTEMEVWAGPVVVAGEYAHSKGTYYPDPLLGLTQGHGAYLSGILTADRMTLLGEYKNYERFEHALVSPPTCVKEHAWTLMNRVTHEVDLGDERGFLVEGSLTLPRDLVMTGGASEARTQGGSLRHWEIFTQLDQMEPWWGVASVAASMSRGYQETGFAEYLTAVVDLDLRKASSQLAEVTFEAQVAEVQTGKKREDHEAYLATVSVYALPDVTLTASAERTTDGESERDTWGFGEIRIKLEQDFEVAVGGGTERGGKKCSGGVCYTEPEFEGVRIRFSTFF